MFFFITWKGRGRVILAVNFIGLLLPVIICQFIKKPDLLPWAFLLGAILAMGGTWWCALTICKTSERKLLDPATGQDVVLKQTHSVYGIPALGCAYIVSILFGGAAICAVFFTWSSSLSRAKSTYPKGGAILNQAEESFSSAESKTANGNSAQAVEFAMKLEALLQTKAKGESAAVDQFTPKTFCHLSSSTCTFIVDLPQVPYQTTSADQLTSKAWFSVLGVFKEFPQRPVNLAVAVRAGTHLRVMAGQSNTSKSGATYRIQINDSSVYAALKLTGFLQNVAD